GPRVPGRPLPSFNLSKKISEQGVECSWLFKVQGMTSLGQDGKTTGRDGLLQEDTGCKAVVVFVTHHDQRGNGQGTQIFLQIVERRAAHLDAAHGKCGTYVRVGRQAISKLAPSAWILVLELHPTRAQRINFGKLPGTLG